MSVIKAKRTLSNMEFFHNALVLRKQLTFLLLRNFGVKDKIRNIKLFERMTNLSDEDKTILENILDKYNIYNVIDEYPQWFLDDSRKNVMDSLRDLMKYIVYANSIYPNSESEYIDRRRYQTQAVSCCYHILQEFQYIISILPCDIEKYMPFVEMIQKEIDLLKGWRKSDNCLLKAIKEKENKGNNTHKGQV